jgi:hypothetical protein
MAGPKNHFRRRWRRHLPRDCAIARVTCKKAGENVSCRLRIDKVFVYFRTIANASGSMRGFLTSATPEKARKTGIQIYTDMHKTTPFSSAAVPEFFQAWRFFI